MAMIMDIGGFARTARNRLGVGKVTALDTDTVTLEYFRSIAERRRICVPRSEARPARLERQTRCYVHTRDERWLMGRIGNYDRHLYEVHLPDCDSGYFDQSQIYVRCNLPIRDPIDILILKGHETAFFHEKRSAFVKSVVRQQAMVRGMTGLVSARIALYPHQVEVARRVLEDPVQRYLLADEVGLGKTIEAGIILRQYLLDYPAEQALVLVPPLLVDQWHTELTDRFYLDERNVVVLGTDELDAVRPEQSYGLLVIDEAHHVAALAFADRREERRRFEVYQRLTRHIPRLLLLSATPVLNNERDFLAMLHLLDPQHYHLDSLDEFRDLVGKRQEIGRLLLSLQEGAAPFVVKLNLKRIKELFAGDAVLTRMAAALTRALGTNPVDRQAVDEIIRSMRIHIAETYRLHRRLLRNRREVLTEQLTHGRGQGGGSLAYEYDLDERTEIICGLLDEWRVCAQNAPSSRRADLGKVFILLLECAGTWLGLLEAAVQCRLGGRDCSVLLREFGPERTTLLQNSPHMDGEREILRELRRVLARDSEEGDRLRLLEMVLENLRLRRGGNALPKCVVFTSFSVVAKQAIGHLYRAFGEGAVAGYLKGVPVDVVEGEIKRFQTDPDCFVLVCDAAGEEGRNLQFADVIIHFDLPWAPNRIEQRIGRLDRIGRDRPYTSILFAGPDGDGSFEDAWLAILRDGFGIFRSSIASLQFFVDVKMPQLLGTALSRGVAGLRDAVGLIGKEIEAEMARIYEQSVLDELDPVQGGADYYESLRQLDLNASRIRADIEPWIAGGLLFHKRGRGGRVEYRPTRKTLVPTSRLARLSTVLDRPGTYRRGVAVNTPYCRLYRIGEEFIDMLSEYIEWDDRGRVFAVWRVDKSWDPAEGAEWIGFRFRYLIEMDTAPVLRVLEAADRRQMDLTALKRRAAAFFPPTLETVYVDSELQKVTDEFLLDLLNRPFVKRADGGSDQNLTKNRVNIIDRLIDADSWDHLCTEARRVSEEVLRTRESFVGACERRARRAEEEFAVRLEQLRLRSSCPWFQRSRKTEAGRDTVLEGEIYNALAEGMRQPRIQPESVGLMVVSGRECSGG